MANILFEIQTQEIENGTNLMKGQSKLTTWSCSNPHMSEKLKNGTAMFEGCFNLSYVCDSFSSLTNGTDMFKSCGKLNIVDVNLSSLEYAERMFYSMGADLTEVVTNNGKSNTLSFRTGLPKLKTAPSMFSNSYVNFFNCDMPMLQDGTHMFSGLRVLNNRSLAFHSTLEELYSGQYMFSNSHVAVINTLHAASNDYSDIYFPYRETYFISMPKLKNGNYMFQYSYGDYTGIQTFAEWDLSSLVDGTSMFERANFVYDFFASTANLVVGKGMFYQSSLSNFNSPLWSLDIADEMFNGDRMTTESIQNIATTIKTNPDSTSTTLFFTQHSQLSTNKAVQAAHLHLKDKGWNVSIPAYNFPSTTLPTNVNNSSGNGWKAHIGNASFRSILGKYACGYTASNTESVLGILNTDLIENGDNMFFGTLIKNWSAPLYYLTSANYMFQYSALNNFYCPTSISADNIRTMFSSCSNLKSVYMRIDGSNKKDTTGIDLSNMFYDNVDIPCPIRAIDIVGDYVYETAYMCCNCYNLSAAKISLPHLRNAIGMFHSCRSLVHTNDLLLGSNGQLTNASDAFCDCVTLTTVPTYSIELAQGADTYRMFCNCKSLRVVDVEDNTTGVSLDLSRIKYGSSMFYNCTNLRKFNSNLTSLTEGNYMFYNCTALTTFAGDLSSLTSGSNMFDNCTNLTTFNSDLGSLTNGSNMFSNCKLDEFSVQNIADTLPTVTSGNISLGVDLSRVWASRAVVEKPSSPWYENERELGQFIPPLQTIVNKGWSVTLNGYPLTSWIYNPTNPT